jgi:hypothetical protein
MKAVKIIFFILCTLSLCSKATLHTYRHFRGRDIGGALTAGATNRADGEEIRSKISFAPLSAPGILERSWN